MRSMTGYGRGECLLYDRRFVVEIKAVNHRYNDITIKLPRVLVSYEDSIKKLLLEKIFRGKTDVYVIFESFSQNDYKVSLNETLADSYFNVLNSIIERYDLKDSVSVSLLSKFPEIISVEKNLSSADSDNEIWECLCNAVNQALEGFVLMRETEGSSLGDNISDKLDFIYSKVSDIEKRAPFVAEEYKKRLFERLDEIKEVEVDESRIITEVTIFADKACIDEEITRLYSHISQMREIIKENAPVGRKLDFLVQEMNREVNTIGSKSNDLNITKVIVELKSEIEKIREQIQNIE